MMLIDSIVGATRIWNTHETHLLPKINYKKLILIYAHNEQFRSSEVCPKQMKQKKDTDPFHLAF